MVEHEGSGIARQVLLPGYLAERLEGQVGRPVALHTHEYLEAQGQGTSFVPRLIGFSQPQERRFFELFTSVKGLGNRKGLRAMALPPAQIALLIAQKDAKGLQKLPEIGKRLAETIIVDLHGKVERFIDPGVIVEPKDDAGLGAIRPELRTAGSEALEVLVALGQTPPEAERAIERALRGAGEKALTGEQIVALVFGGEG